jgi:hypothetical protein
MPRIMSGARAPRARSSENVETLRLGGRLAPGEARMVSLTLDARELRMLDDAGDWTVEPGVYQLLVGASSRDIRLRGEIEVR